MLTLYVKYTAKPGCRENYVRDIVSEGILTTPAPVDAALDKFGRILDEAEACVAQLEAAK